MFVSLFVCLSVCMWGSVGVWPLMDGWMCVCVCVCVRACGCMVCMYVCMYVGM